MTARIVTLCSVLALLTGCEGAIREQRLIEAQRQQYEQHLQTERLNNEYRIRAEQARIQAAAQVQAEATRAAEERMASEYRSQVLGRVLRLLIVASGIVIGVGGLVWGFLLFRAYVIRERLKAVVALGDQMNDRQRTEVIAGLLAASGVDAGPLLLEHKPE